MPALDLIHEAVKSALIKDGWTITDDPYRLEYEETDLYVDLAAERVVAAERNGQKIAVEIKTFAGRSEIRDFEEALGQYMLYKGVIDTIAPDRKLYIAISDYTYLTAFKRKAIQLIIGLYHIPLIIIDVDTEEVKSWIN